MPGSVKELGALWNNIFSLPNDCDKVKNLVEYCGENKHIEVYQVGKLWMRK